MGIHSHQKKPLMRYIAACLIPLLQPMSLILIGVCVLAGCNTRTRMAEYSFIYTRPITAVISQHGGSHIWYLSINSAGDAELTIFGIGDPIRHRFVIAERQLMELRNALVEQDFFGLADTYGELVPDGSSDAITIVFGQRSKTVEIHFLMNWVNEAPHRLKEPSRAIRILLLTHAWLNDFEELGIDRGRQQYEMVLDAME